MHDVSDIRLVNAHAEGVRRDDDVQPVAAVVKKRFLDACALVRFQPGVIMRGAKPAPFQVIGDVLGVTAGAGVDNPVVACGMFREEFDEPLIFFIFIAALLHAQFQIRTFNPLRHHFGCRDMEQIRHVFSNFRWCCCGEERDDMRLERV